MRRMLQASRAGKVVSAFEPAAALKAKLRNARGVNALSAAAPIQFRRPRGGPNPAGPRRTGGAFVSFGTKAWGSAFHAWSVRQGTDDARSF
jgi:hypothetical protein